MKKLISSLLAVMALGGTALAADRMSVEGYGAFRWGLTEDQVAGLEARITRTPTSREAFDTWRERLSLADALPVQMVAPLRAGFYFDGEQKLRAIVFRQPVGQGSLDACERVLHQLEQQWGPAGKLERTPDGNTFFASWSLGLSEAKLNCNVAKDGRRSAEVILADRSARPARTRR